MQRGVPTCHHQWPARVPCCCLCQCIHRVGHHKGRSRQQPLMHPARCALELKRQRGGCHVCLQVTHLQAATDAHHLRSVRGVNQAQCGPSTMQQATVLACQIAIQTAIVMVVVVMASLTTSSTRCSRHISSPPWSTETRLCGLRNQHLHPGHWAEDYTLYMHRTPAFNSFTLQNPNRVYSHKSIASSPGTAASYPPPRSGMA